MKATTKLLVAAMAAAGLAVAVPASAAGGHSGGGHFSGGHSGGGHWSGGGGHWGGGRSGGHWSGGHWGHRGGHLSFFIGAPVVLGSWWWGWPYYDYYYAPYPRETVIYREVERYPEAEIGPPAEARPGPGSPTQGPLYMNYCESARAYYPKVTSCPEGWRFVAPAPQSEPVPQQPRY
ncbi:MAG TPA: hypothetical protein VFP44_08700 [Usitatibacter sp.]|nr:hypothetical protein [Usitatibacter sp.]